MTPAAQLKRVGDLVDILGGGTPSKKEPSYWSGPVPWVSPKDMKRWEIHDAIDHVSHAAVTETACKLVNPPAVLLVVRGMILAHSVPVAISRVPLAINQDLKALVPKNGVDPEYLAFMLAGAAPQLLSRVDIAGHGTRRLPTEAWTSLEIRVPPLPEQQRIVERIKRCMSRVNEARQLQAQSTVEARGLQGSIINSVVRTEWPRRCLADVCLDIRNGWSGKQVEDGYEVGALRLSSVHSLTIDEKDVKLVRVRQAVVDDFCLRAGDVFLVRGNGSRHLVARTAIAARDSRSVIFNDLLIRLRPRPDVAPTFLNYVLQSSDVRRELEEASKTAAGIWKINQKALGKIQVPVPSLATQQSVVDALDEALEAVRGIVEILPHTAVDALGASILRKAFAGEL